MKKTMYALILPLVAASVIVFANRETRNETSNRSDLQTMTSGNARIVFRLTDGGQTWQDISKGLPENYWADSTRGNTFFVNDRGLFLEFGYERYHSTPNATAPYWTREIFREEDRSTKAVKPGTTYWGVNLITKNGTSVWSPMFGNASEPRLRNAFETSGGALFISTDQGIFKTDDHGNTWKHVYDGGWAGHLAESNGILVATSKRDIIRSTDHGETWEPAVSEDPVTWDVKPFRDGFVALTSFSEPSNGSNRLSTSFDGGKTWQSVHSSLQDKAVIDSIGRTWNDRPVTQAYQTSVIEVGDYFLCMHSSGIFKSSDQGKTWKLILSAIDEKGFHLFISGNVIYAVRSKGGC